MKTDEKVRAQYVQKETYASIGETITKPAKYGIKFNSAEIIRGLNFIDFANLHDTRVKLFNEIGTKDEERTIEFVTSNKKEKVLKFTLDKQVGLIDFNAIEKAEITIQELLGIIYWHPEINAMFQKWIDEEKRFVFSQTNDTDRKNRKVINYQSNDKASSFEGENFAVSDRNGVITKIGNKGRILTQLVYEWGCFLDIPGYSIAKPVTAEEKAQYEVQRMINYYSRID